MRCAGRPLDAGRPRVTDTRAGLSYAVPEGWKHAPAKDRQLTDAAHLQMTLVTVDGERTSFLLGLTTGTADPKVTADIGAVLADAAVR
ncbi:hypothetical protein ACWC2T_21050 [Streptomyces sp. NPDC001393]